MTQRGSYLNFSLTGLISAFVSRPRQSGQLIRCQLLLCSFLILVATPVLHRRSTETLWAGFILNFLETTRFMPIDMRCLALDALLRPKTVTLNVELKLVQFKPSSIRFLNVLGV